MLLCGFKPYILRDHDNGNAADGVRYTVNHFSSSDGGLDLLTENDAIIRWHGFLLWHDKQHDISNEDPIVTFFPPRDESIAGDGGRGG